MEKLVPVLTTMAVIAPLVIVWLVGIGLALSRWRRHPLTLQERGWTMTQIGSMLMLISAVSALIDISVWVLLLCAIFGGRAGQQKQSLVPPPPPPFATAPAQL